MTIECFNLVSEYTYIISKSYFANFVFTDIPKYVQNKLRLRYHKLFVKRLSTRNYLEHSLFPNNLFSTLVIQGKQVCEKMRMDST